MSFDPTKPVQTRDGRPARILATDVDHPDLTIAAAYRSKDGDREFVDAWRADGRNFPPDDIDSPLDLVNVPERTSRTIRIYNEGGFAGHALASFENGKLVAIEPVP